jgi:hypothetical protein
MVIVVMGLKYVLKDHGLHLYLQLFIYIIAGALTYLLVIQLIAPSLSRQVLALVDSALPDWKIKMNQYIRLRGGH